MYKKTQPASVQKLPKVFKDIPWCIGYKDLVKGSKFREHGRSKERVDGDALLILADDPHLVQPCGRVYQVGVNTFLIILGVLQANKRVTLKIRIR